MATPMFAILTNIMKLQDAINLIEGGEPFGSEPLRWADLGSGSGLFSRALAFLLPRSSKVLCLDRDAQHFKDMTIDGVKLEFTIGDFTTYDFGHTTFDGFMLANSIHFVQDKKALLANLRDRLKTKGRLLLIEYESQIANAWVPYPIPFADLISLGETLGFRSARKLGKYDSIYDSGTMYSCELRMQVQ